ncbi:MAG: VWA domain-containing protein [Bacteroidetes bacterium]|nr:VWA domain-containing protein [Bacteroidota bacterium]
MPRFRYAILALLLLLPAHADAQLQLFIDSLDISAFPDIRMLVRVTEGNSAVRGLKVADFTVFEDGFVQPITAGYCRDTLSRGPVSVLLLMDVSRSMGGWPWGNDAIIDAKRAAKSFVDRLSDDDEIALVSFSAETYYNQPWTNNRTLVKQKIDQLDVISGTALWDAVMTSANLIRYRMKKKVMIVLADGQDGSSENPASLAISYAIDAGCVVYTIGLGDDVDEQNMTTLASQTGGRYYHAPNATDLDQIYAEIIQQLETTGICELNYRSPIDCWNGDKVSVEVEAMTPRGVAMSATSYNLPYDTTTFSYVNVAMGREFVVEAGEEITVPVELTRVSAQRAPSRFDFSVDYDQTLLQLIDVRTAELTPLFTISHTPTLRGSDVTIIGGKTITTPGQLCELTFRAANSFESRKTEIAVSPPDVQQFCTVATSNDGLVTVSGTCERAIHQSAGKLSRSYIVGNSPNPFTGVTTITYHMGSELPVRLSVRNALGAEVAELVNAVRSTSTHSVQFDASGLSSGIYMVKLETETESDVLRITLTK